MTWSSLHHLTNGQIDRFAAELEQAVENHVRWTARVNRALLLGEGAPQDDLAEQPHFLCHFGRWYQRAENAPLRELDAFIAIGPHHDTAHALARTLLRMRCAGEGTAPADYDAWVAEGEALRHLFQTVRDELRHNLRITSLLMAKVFENAAEGVIITAPDGTILTVNRAFTAVTGYSAEEAIGRTPRILHSGRHDRRFHEQMWRKLTSEGEWQGEIWNRRKSGEIYLEWLSINAVRNELGEITHYVAMFTDITTEKQNAERLYHLAHFDPLTELPNRLLFQDRFNQALARARRGNLQLAVAFLDLDGFKEVNDRFGHSAGDALLAQVAARLSAQLRKSDTVARLGGDEFSIILPDLHETEGLVRAAQKVVDAIAKPFTLRAAQKTAITTSVGISIYPKGGHDVDSLLRRADIAMYEAKRQGKNRICFFDASME